MVPHLVWMNQRLLGYSRKLGFSYLWHHLLETQEEDLQPYPSQHQQDDHSGEGKTKPGSKVYHVAILGEEPNEGDMGYCVTLSLKLPDPIFTTARVQIPHSSCPPLPWHSRIHLALEHQVGGSACQSGDAPNAGRVANA